MNADEKILLALDKLCNKFSKIFFALEKRVKLIQSVIEIQFTIALNTLFYKSKIYKKKFSQAELRKQRHQRLQNFLGNPLEI